MGLEYGLCSGPAWHFANEVLIQGALGPEALNFSCSWWAMVTAGTTARIQPRDVPEQHTEGPGAGYPPPPNSLMVPLLWS
jgi:hypothetical protein